jgi:hypothetical protein
MDQMTTPKHPPPRKKSSTLLYHIAMLVSHDELVVKITCAYTVQSKCFMTDFFFFFKSKTHEEDTKLF